MADTNVRIQLELVDGPAQKALADIIKTTGAADKSIGGLNKSLSGLSKGVDENTVSFSGFAKIITEDLGGKGAAQVGQLASVLGGPLLIALGSVAAAGVAVSKALDLTLLAERNQQIENSFNAIAASAGLAGSALRDDLVGAAKGLADDTDILRASNKAIIELGANASKLPEIMDVARKTTALFGGELLDNFSNLSQALASGNTKALRNIGLIIDAEAAQRSYAKSLGVSVEFLSEAGKKQAVTNAALEQAKDKFKDVDESSTQASQALSRFKASVSGLGDAVASSAKASGFFSTIFDYLGERAASAGALLKGHFGNAVETTEYQLTKAQASVTEYSQQLSILQMKLAKQPGNQKAGLEAEIEKVSEKLAAAESTVTSLSKSFEKLNGPQTKSDAKPASQVDRIALAKKESETLDAQSKASAEIQTAIAQEQADHEIAILKDKLTTQQITQAEFDAQSAALSQGSIAAKQAADDARFLDENARLQANFDAQLIGATDYYSKRDKLANDYALNTVKNEANFQKAKDTARTTNLAREEKDRKDSFATIATLANSSNHTLASIGKAAGITQIAIDTPVAISKALAAFPPPFNFIAAGLVGTAMAAQAAQIAGVNFADGGIVPGTSYTGDRVAANVNSGEMVINRSQQSNLWSQIKNGGAGDNSEMVGLLRAIASRDENIIVNIGGKTVVETLRSELAAGRSV